MTKNSSLGYFNYQNVERNRNDRVKKTIFLEFYTKWDSYTPTKQKSNIMDNLFHCSHQNICSSFTLLHLEVNQISLVLKQNGYPKNFLNKRIIRFLKKHYDEDSPKKHIFKKLRAKNFFCGYRLFAKFHS